MSTIKHLQTLLRFTYGLLAIAAGLDKFTNLLTNWADYLGNNRHLLPLEPLVFMRIVGVIEIIAGLIVFVYPRLGGFIVMAWLICIALQLIAGGGYYDVAVRDLVLAVGAYTLAQLHTRNLRGEPSKQ
ncbi:DoxX family membrane protein [Sediminibacterium soli]|uniref:DoxX family membrane protein n=1 Tax=Sediminibacterium soli TaxID=2698829 RepID=UPI00137B6AAA|nr:DoxX family membrane protein [Sediminibacterium soli]NCI46764.1 DoxX family membrane protein [Sediminibacterium soli]